MIELASETAQHHYTTGLPMKASLLHPSAAALNQDNQNDDKQHTCDNLNNCGAIHLNPLSCKKFVRAFHVSTGEGHSLCQLGEVLVPRAANQPEMPRRLVGRRRDKSEFSAT
jgi:hypothetical protein